MNTIRYKYGGQVFADGGLVYWSVGKAEQIEFDAVLCSTIMVNFEDIAYIA